MDMAALQFTYSRSPNAAFFKIFIVLTRIACNLWVASVIGRARASPTMLPAFAVSVGAALVYHADVDTAARVALLAGPAVVVVDALGLSLDPVTLPVVAHDVAVRTHACNGSGWEGVLHNALLSGNARVAVPARVLAPLVYACMLGGAVSIDPALGLLRYFDCE